MYGESSRAGNWRPSRHAVRQPGRYPVISGCPGDRGSGPPCRLRPPMVVSAAVGIHLVFSSARDRNGRPNMVAVRGLYRRRSPRKADVASSRCHRDRERFWQRQRAENVPRANSCYRRDRGRFWLTNMPAPWQSAPLQGWSAVTPIPIAHARPQQHLPTIPNQGRLI